MKSSSTRLSGRLTVCSFSEGFSWNFRKSIIKPWAEIRDFAEGISYCFATNGTNSGFFREIRSLRVKRNDHIGKLIRKCWWIDPDNLFADQQRRSDGGKPFCGDGFRIADSEDAAAGYCCAVGTLSSIDCKADSVNRFRRKFCFPERSGQDLSSVNAVSTLIHTGVFISVFRSMFWISGSDRHRFPNESQRRVHHGTSCHNCCKMKRECPVSDSGLPNRIHRAGIGYLPANPSQNFRGR